MRENSVSSEAGRTKRQPRDIPFRLKELTAVYLGCRMSDADREEIRAIVGKKYPHAVIQAGTKSARRFALEFARAA